MTFGESPFGATLAEVINKIVAGNSDFSLLAKSKSLIGFRWLDAVNLIKWMTHSDHAKRPSPDQLVNDIFFKSAQDRKTIILAANELLKSPILEVSTRA